MKLKITTQIVYDVEVAFTFPMFRSRLQGDYNCAGFKKEYWKFESIHKVTKITEEMCQTTILTFDDPNADFVQDMMPPDMLYGRADYDIIPEKVYDAATDRLINKLFKA